MPAAGTSPNATSSRWWRRPPARDRRDALVALIRRSGQRRKPARHDADHFCLRSDSQLPRQLALDDVSLDIEGAAIHRPAGSQWRRQDHAHACHRRAGIPDRRQRPGSRCLTGGERLDPAPDRADPRRPGLSRYQGSSGPPAGILVLSELERGPCRQADGRVRASRPTARSRRCRGECGQRSASRSGWRRGPR